MQASLIAAGEILVPQPEIEPRGPCIGSAESYPLDYRESPPSHTFYEQALCEAEDWIVNKTHLVFAFRKLLIWWRGPGIQGSYAETYVSLHWQLVWTDLSQSGHATVTPVEGWGGEA